MTSEIEIRRGVVLRRVVIRGSVLILWGRCGCVLGAIQKWGPAVDSAARIFSIVFGVIHGRWMGTMMRKVKPAGWH